MAGKLFKIDRFVDRAGYWWGGYLMLSGAYTWLLDSVPALSEWNWAMLVLAGIAAAIITALLVTAAMAMYRLFSPLPVTQAARAEPTTAVVPNSATDGGDRRPTSGADADLRSEVEQLAGKIAYLEAVTGTINRDLMEVARAPIREVDAKLEAVRNEIAEAADRAQATADEALAKSKALIVTDGKRKEELDGFRDRIVSVLHWWRRRERYYVAVERIPDEAQWLSNAIEADMSEPELHEYHYRMQRWLLDFDTFVANGHDAHALRQKEYDPTAEEIAAADWPKSEDEFQTRKLCLLHRKMRLKLRFFENHEEDVSRMVDYMVSV